MSEELNHGPMPESPESPLWPVFDWQEGTCSWDAAELSSAMPPISSASEAASAPAPAPARKRKRHTTGEGVAAAFLYVAGVLVSSFLIATVGWHLGCDLLALNKEPRTVSITVDEGEPLSEVAADLKFNGLIDYKFLFQAFAGFTHKGSNIVSGTYELSTEMDYSALLSNMSSTSSYRETVTVTIPEGFTAQEIFKLLEDQGVCTAEKLTDAAEENTFGYSFLEDINRSGVSLLEGYLFPDTYEFYKGTDAENVLNRLLTNYQEHFTEGYRAKAQKLGYTQDEVLRIASIIEKETTGDDREEISSVIHNRLNNPDHPDTKGYLQMDSTVQYCLEERKEKLTNADLEIDSPYNTYLYPGLPQGPICCPGADSIEAALNPQDTNYYFFMLGDDGEDHFFEDRTSFESFRNAQTGEAED